jgi:hypothetical protein
MKKFNTMTAAEAQKNAEAFDLAIATGTHDSYMEERKNEFLDSWDFTQKPSRHAKALAAYSRKEILLYEWDNFLAFNEGHGEFVCGMNATESLGQLTRIELVKRFHGWLGGVLEAFDKEESK